jgi:hypothetical protein
MKNHADEFSCSIPDNHFQCFPQLTAIFQGQPFVFEEKMVFSLMFLIDYFGFSCLIQTIPQSLVFPQNLEEAMNFLSESFCFKFNQQFQNSVLFLTQNIHGISSEHLQRLQNSALVEMIRQMKQESDQIKMHNEKYNDQIAQVLEENSSLNDQLNQSQKEKSDSIDQINLLQKANHNLAQRIFFQNHSVSNSINNFKIQFHY